MNVLENYFVKNSEHTPDGCNSTTCNEGCYRYQFSILIASFGKVFILVKKQTRHFPNYIVLNNIVMTEKYNKKKKNLLLTYNHKKCSSISISQL